MYGTRYTRKAIPPFLPGTDASQLAGIAKSDLPVDVMDLFKNLFAGGSKSAEEFKKSCPSIENISAMEWFKEDLPAEAGSMTEVYKKKTAMRRTSPALQRLKGLVEKITATPDGKLAPAAGKAGNQVAAPGKPNKAPAAGTYAAGMHA